jgi:hypothetical protein
MKELRVLNYSVPLFTNAHVNRERAMEMFKAGMPPEAIAKEFGAVFFSSDGKLGQKYDSIYRGTEIKETRFMITSEATKKAIAGFKAAKKSARASAPKKRRAPKVKLLTARELLKKAMNFR